MPDVKMDMIRRANAGDETAKRALQILIDPTLGRKAEKLINAAHEQNVERIIYLLARIQDIRDLIAVNPTLKRAIDHAIYLHMSPGKEKILKNIIARIEEVGDRIHIAGKNPPVIERYEIEEVIHTPRHRSVSESAADLLRIARMLRDKHGITIVDDPRIFIDGEPVKMHTIDSIIKTLKSGPSPGYVAFAHDVLLYAAGKRGLGAIVEALKGITVHGRIAKVRKLKLTKKNERFILAKKASADCTAPGGAAFDSFTIPALISNSIGNLEIYADVVEHDQNPKRKGMYKIAKNKHVGNVSIMVGKTEDGKDVLYVHHIEFNYPQRLVANAEDLAKKIVSWLSDYARANRFDILAFDPVQISNHGYFAKRIYTELDSLGAKEIEANKIHPLDHITGERTTPLDHYGAPWTIAKRDGAHPRAIEL